MKKLGAVFLLFIILFCSGYKKPYKYVIDAEKDAFYHNNVGLTYLRDRIYYAAIQEFKIAISLSPSTQASAIFYNNLGETYVFIGYPEQAQVCFEDAIKLYGLNFKYYMNLVNCYKDLGIVNSKIKELEVSQDVYDRIKLGVLLIETGQVRKGINILDEISILEPDLIITGALRQYIKETVVKSYQIKL
jgi:tetratricopeptide (TPR) repeat protein